MTKKIKVICIICGVLAELAVIYRMVTVAWEAGKCHGLGRALLERYITRVQYDELIKKKLKYMEPWRNLRLFVLTLYVQARKNQLLLWKKDV